MIESTASPVELARGHAFPAAARRLFGNVRLEFPHGLEDRSRLRSVTLGACRLSRLEAETHTVFGDRVVSGTDNPDSLKLIVQTAGKAVLAQSGRRVDIGGKYTVLYDPTHPYVLENTTPVRLLLLQLPRSAFGSSLLARLKDPLPVPARAAGLNRVLASMMASTLSEIDTLDEAMRRTVGDTMVGIVRNLTGESRGETGCSSLETLFRRIEIHVAENVANPDLTVEGIARRMGCSERYVYRAFESRDTTPGDYIWSLRVARAAERLRLTAPRAETISAIAFDLGFSSSAHFSRAFRHRYGMTPSDWRRTGRD